MNRVLLYGLCLHHCWCEEIESENGWGNCCCGLELILCRDPKLLVCEPKMVIMCGIGVFVNG